MNARVTQRDIAREAGVDVSTVSLSLMSHPKIPEETRDRILAIARRLGYRRDPALSAIAASRWSKSRGDSGLVIAFVVDDLQSAEIELKLYLEGAAAQATALGYRCDPFQLSDYSSVTALQHVLRARGIRGRIIGQSRKELPTALFTEEEMPTVHCGYLRDVPGDVVGPDLRMALNLLVEMLCARHRPVICFLPVEPTLHSDCVILGAALARARMAPRGSLRVQVVSPSLGAKEMAQLEKMRPGAVITINERHTAAIVKQTRIPRDCIYTVHTLPPFANKRGTDLRLNDVGRAAMNLLEIKLLHQPLATRTCRQSLLVAPHFLGTLH